MVMFMVMVVVMVTVKIQSPVPPFLVELQLGPVSEWVVRSIINEQEAHAQQVPNQASTYVTTQKCRSTKLQTLEVFGAQKAHAKNRHLHVSLDQDWCQSSEQKLIVIDIIWSVSSRLDASQHWSPILTIKLAFVVDICKWLPWLQRHTHIGVESPEYWGPPTKPGWLNSDR